MKSLPKIDLPREKLEKYGLQKLADYELLAILLGSGIKGTNVLQLSKKILTIVYKIGDANLTLDDLVEINGLGKAKASQVLAALELGRRTQAVKNPEVLSPQDVWNLCADFRASKKENFAVFYLDTQNRLIERIIISVGTLSESLVHPREVFEPAVRLSAASILIAHNHPSGIVTPSAEDVSVTKRLSETGDIIGIKLLDHIIVSSLDFTSISIKKL